MPLVHLCFCCEGAAWFVACAAGGDHAPDNLYRPRKTTNLTAPSQRLRQVASNAPSRQLRRVASNGFGHGHVQAAMPCRCATVANSVGPMRREVGACCWPSRQPVALSLLLFSSVFSLTDELRDLSCHASRVRAPKSRMTKVVARSR